MPTDRPPKGEVTTSRGSALRALCRHLLENQGRLEDISTLMFTAGARPSQGLWESLKFSFFHKQSCLLQSGSGPLSVTARDESLTNGTCLCFSLLQQHNDKRLLLVATCPVFRLGHGSGGCQSPRAGASLGDILKEKQKQRKDEGLTQGGGSCVGRGS